MSRNPEPEAADRIVAALGDLADAVRALPTRRAVTGAVFVGAVVRVADSPEPPVGAVVLDREGDAWQRQPRGWHTATSNDTCEPWVGMDYYGPLTVVYVPAAVQS